MHPETTEKYMESCSFNFCSDSMLNKMSVC